MELNGFERATSAMTGTSSTQLVDGLCGALRSPREADAQAGGDALRRPINRALCREVRPIHFHRVSAGSGRCGEAERLGLVHDLHTGTPPGRERAGFFGAVLAHRRDSLIRAHRVQSLFGSPRHPAHCGRGNRETAETWRQRHGCGDRRGCPNLPRRERHTNYLSFSVRPTERSTL